MTDNLTKKVIDCPVCGGKIRIEIGARSRVYKCPRPGCGSAFTVFPDGKVRQGKF